MAATVMTEAQIELVNSLAQDDIPIKLRCAICSKLAVNAFRLPCCDQAICETCQSSLPNSCPVCEHSPVSGEDCKPHKSLRTTIKVFLRTEEKKRNAALAKAAKEKTPETPVEPTAPALSQENITEQSNEIPATSDHENVTSSTGDAAANCAELQQDDAATTNQDDNQQDVAHQSIEVRHKASGEEPQSDKNQEIAPGQEPTEGETNVDEAKPEDGAEESITNADGTTATGMDPTKMGAFPAMGMMGGDMSAMNPMQQQMMMMAMQGGMPFGGFPMMGMPGMPMDPMAMQQMQQMYMQNGFGGMGMGNMNNMNGMGMGMGFGAGGNDGNFNGSGGYGQQGFNSMAGDNFNANAAQGMGSQAHNDSGYGGNRYPNQNARGGYGQGYGRGGYNDGGYGGGYGRGRGRGRGGFGRGGWNGDYGHHGAMTHNFSQNNAMTGANTMEAGSKDATTTNAESAPNPNVDEFGREIRPKASEEPDADAKTATDGASKDASHTQAIDTEMNGAWTDQPSDANAFNAQYSGGDNWGQEGGVMPIQAVGGDDNYGYGYRSNAAFAVPPPVDVPINAPTGPKAMREGLPNTSIKYLQRDRGRSYNSSGEYARPHNDGEEARDRNAYDDERAAHEEGRRERHEGHRSRSLRRSRSRDREDRHRSSRHHRDDEDDEDAKESERRRERRRRRREEAEAAAIAEGGEKLGTEDAAAEDEKDKDRDERKRSRSRSRSASPAESRRESHRGSRHEKSDRSERDKDHYAADREKSERDRYAKEREERHRQREKGRGSGHDRDKDRESKRDRSRHRERDGKDRDRSRDRRRDRDDKHRSSHRSHLDRSRSRDKDDKRSRRDRSRSRDKERSSRSHRDRDRESDRDSHRDRDRDHRSSRSHRHSRDDSTTELPKEEAMPKPPSGPRAMQSNSIFDQPAPGSGGFKIRGGANRAGNGNGTDFKAPPAKKAVDPHTAEREKRDRERLLKEAQRMAGLAGLVNKDKKRSMDAAERDRGVDARSGKRRKGGKGNGGRGGMGLDGADERDGEGEERNGGEVVRRESRDARADAAAEAAEAAEVNGGEA